MIYKQENITPNKFIRTFKSDVDSSELVWHRDKKSRIVEVLNDSDWFVQLENELPRKLNKGDIFFIAKESYHRVIKGDTDLKVQIIEEKGIKLPIEIITISAVSMCAFNKIGSLTASPYTTNSPFCIFSLTMSGSKITDT